MVMTKALYSTLAFLAGGTLIGMTSLETPKTKSTTRQEEKVDQAKLYLQEFAGYLTVEPRDGFFGMSRVPTIHGGRPDGPKIEQAFLEMGKTSYVTGMAFGNLAKDQEVRYSTSPTHYQLHEIPEESVGLGKPDIRKLNSRLTEELLPNEARNLWNSGRKESRFNIPYGKLTAVVTMRKVMPSYESCLSCHTNVPHGKAIGVLAVVQVPRGSAKP